jgi:hypothetical protein
MQRWHRLLGFAALFAVVPIANAQSSKVQSTAELEDFLYILDPHFKQQPNAIDLMWIPKPVESLCLGKPFEKCASIDYCSRTTNQHISICQNLGMDLSKLPKYPSDVRPKRVLSIMFYQESLIKGWAALRTYFEGQPPGTFDRVSKSQRIRARIKLTRSTDDDQFELLEVLAVSPI